MNKADSHLFLFNYLLQYSIPGNYTAQVYFQSPEILAHTLPGTVQTS